MARRVKGVTERLLECAKAEFLEKGYENASLRTIAHKAGSSKGAIYIRYPDKASLFSALVKDAADGLFGLTKSMHEKFFELSGEEQKAEVRELSDHGMKEFVDYIYQHFDEFKLLLTCSDGTSTAQFIHRLVELEITTTYRFIKNTSSDAVRKGRLTSEFFHLVSESFLRGVFEIVVHDMPRKKGEEYILRLRKFFAAGWMTIFDDLQI